MLTKVEIRPVSGSAVEVNAVDGSGNHLYPLSAFDIVTNIDSRDAKKMAAPGQWPTFAYPDAMTIHAEGNILGVGGSDAARATSYITQRLALLDAILPPVTLLTSRKHAVLRVRFDGMTEDADADVIVIQQSIPMAALFPANSQYMITWKAFLPYFVGLTTSTQYQLG
ncbi:MAG: hypothetical protein H0U18_16260 [Pyrinomonadaceae bacterium]|nr:hypothetical protein [Pyrinomonadaceae bacterium]